MLISFDLYMCHQLFDMPNSYDLFFIHIPNPIGNEQVIFYIPVFVVFVFIILRTEKRLSG